MLELATLDNTKILSIYSEINPVLPIRFSRLHPVARECFLNANRDANHLLVLSDMWRSGQASLRRRYPNNRWLPRRSVKPPGYSAHNYGLAIDIAITRTLENMRCSKRVLDEFLEQFGWYCHRRDHKRRSEEWHYNFIGLMGHVYKHERTTAAAVERRILATYQKEWEAVNVRLALKYLYPFGANIKTFQKIWRLKVDGIVGPVTKRTLWYVFSERKYLDSVNKLS